MRAVIYARVSTKGQAAEEKISIPDQIKKARETAESHGWILVHEPFIDAGISGRKFEERKALQDMLNFIRQGKSDIVIVYDGDRIGRRSSVSQHIYEIMDKYKVQLYSLSQPVEPKTPGKYNPLEDDSGFILRSVTSMTSEMYVRQLARRMRAGKENLVRQGKLYGTPPYGYAYIYNHDGSRKLVIDEPRAAVVRRIYRQYLAGVGVRTIAMRLNADGISSMKGNGWCGSSVYQMLRNHHYIGKTVCRKSITNENGKRVLTPQSEWIIAQGVQQPIVTEEDWSKVIELRAKKACRGRTFGQSHVLSGIVRCGLCGRSMVAGTGRYKGETKIHTIVCAGYHTSGSCERNSYRADYLLNELLDYLTALAKNPELIEKVKSRQSKEHKSSTQEMLITLEKEAELISKRLEKCRYAFETGVDTLAEYQRHKSGLEEKKTTVAARIKELQEEIEILERAKAVKKHFTDLISDLPNKFVSQPLSTQKVLLRSIIERVIIQRKAFHVEFKF